ncbi:thiol reductant ABC exporter subunit CydC, partial [Levilactobacillus zymae]
LVVERFRKAEQKQLNHDAYVSLTDSVLGLSDWVITHREKDFMSQSLAAPKKLAASTVKSKRFQWRRDFVGQLLFVLIVIS